MSGHQAGIYRKTQPIIAEIERLAGSRPKEQTFRYGGGSRVYVARTSNPWGFGNGLSRDEALCNLLDDIKEATHD